MANHDARWDPRVRTGQSYFLLFSPLCACRYVNLRMFGEMFILMYPGMCFGLLIIRVPTRLSLSSLRYRYVSNLFFRHQRETLEPTRFEPHCPCASYKTRYLHTYMYLLGTGIVVLSGGRGEGGGGAYLSSQLHAACRVVSALCWVHVCICILARCPAHMIGTHEVAIEMRETARRMLTAVRLIVR